MSDLWSFSSSSPAPIIHHSSPFISSPPPPFSSPTSPGNHGNHLYAKVPSCHLLPPVQVSSPHLPEPQVTSPSHLLYQPQETSPHCVSWSQETAPYLFPQGQLTSPHLTHVTSPHLPHPYVTSPHLAPQPQVTSPHLLSPPLHHLPNQNPDPGLDYPNWRGAELPAELPYSYCQNQSTGHPDLQLQNQFSTAVTHTDLPSGVFEQGRTPGPVQDCWRPLGPPLSQLQCSPLGSVSGEVALGRWSSEFSSSPAEDSCSTQFFHNNAPQPFCSPNTPGPSPHYPQTPTISSPGPQMHPKEERLDLHLQTSRQLNSCRLHEYDSFKMTSDPCQTSLLQTHGDRIQDQTGLLDAAGNPESCFSPQEGGQDVSSAAPAAGPRAGSTWREEGGGGRGGRKGGRGGGQPDWSWIKRPLPKNSTEVLDCRLQCTVCQREFRSLPALNGHMRSHSGSRATWFNKTEDPSPLVPPSVSMVIPVTVPVRSRGSAKTCRGGQRKLTRLSLAGGHPVLYRSLLHRDQDEGEGEEEGGAHYTPPPMLCPLRAAPGLYCSLTTRRQQRVETVQLHNTNNGLDDPVAMETASPPPGTLTPGIKKPRINIGRGFQAEVPPLRARKHTQPDSHNALLLWTPREELERPANQQRVEALMTMARSSVVPGGGASLESALHVLSECRGDFLLSVEKLLETNNNNNKHSGQQHPGWSAAETKLLVKSLQLHQKDFRRIQKAVQTKSLSQCVEFYYLWKKKLSLSVRTSAGLTVTLPNTNGQRSSRSQDVS